MNDLLDNVYLPDLKKRSIRESDAYKLLKDNNKDTSVLEGYDNTENIEPIEFPVFNTQGDKDKFIEENATSTASTAKDYLETFGNFLTDETEDLVTSLQLAAVNGADVAVNLMPLAYKMFETAPIAMAMPKEFFNTETEEDVMRVAKHYSDNLGEYRKHLFEKQKDNGWVKDILSLVVQDSAYSIPAFNMMRKAGVPKYPAFFLSAAFGAIGVENVDRDGDKTYFAPFQKDVQELKKLLNILPDTPADKIADEVHQALEYGSFGTAIPGIIDAFVFMKKYLPKFSTVTGSTAAVAGMTADNEAEGSPFKAIVNAVTKVPIFKSAVRDAAETKITKGNADQIYNTIKNTPGVKEAELKWLDLEESLKARSQIKKAPLTKDEVLEIIDNNKVDVSEVSFGGTAARLSDDLEQKIIDFEQKVEKAARAQDLGYADINYDVYPYARRLAGNTNIDKVRKETSMDFSQLNDLLLGLPLNSKTFLDDFTTKSGQIEIHKFTDNLNNRPVYVGRELAEELINEKEVVRDIPAALNSPGTPRYTRNRVLEFEPLEIEKFLIEREKRIFMKDNASPKFERYTEPGGDDYTELVFKIKKGGMDIGIPTTRYDDNIKYTPYKNPSHMDVKSEIAHVRFKTRMNGDMKLLAVEEMQSDFGIRTTKIKKADIEQIDELSGEQLGLMADEAFPGNKFTVEEAQRKLKGNVKAYDFPFKNNWYELTIKRLARYAADNGFDGIAIPKGDKAANRYGESITKAQKIGLQIVDGPKKGSYFFDLNYMNEAGNIVERGPSFNQSNYQEMEKVIGKKEFKNIQSQIEELINDQEEIGEFMLRDFNIPYKKDIILGSGAGKYRLYNETIPSYMKKYAKKWNAKVYDENIKQGPTVDMDSISTKDRKFGFEIPVTVLELSDEMKTGVTSSSQPLFELFGGVSLSTWGAKAVSDSMKNNTISQTTN